jgi:hypothetical protein
MALLDEKRIRKQLNKLEIELLGRGKSVTKRDIIRLGLDELERGLKRKRTKTL